MKVRQAPQPRRLDPSPFQRLEDLLVSATCHQTERAQAHGPGSLQKLSVVEKDRLWNGLSFGNFPISP